MPINFEPSQGNVSRIAEAYGASQARMADREFGLKAASRFAFRQLVNEFLELSLGEPDGPFEESFRDFLQDEACREKGWRTPQ